MKKFLLITGCFLGLVAQITAQNVSEDIQSEIDGKNAEISQLIRQKNYRDSLPIAKKLTEFVGIKLGNDHLEFAKSAQTLGFLHYIIDNFEDADKILTQSLRAYDLNKDKVDEKSIIVVLETLSFVKHKRDKYEDAGRLLEKATIMREALEGASSPKVIANLLSLGNLHYSVNSYLISADFYRRVFDTKRNLSSTTGSELFDIYTRCECSMYKAGFIEEAELFKEKYYPIVSRKNKIKNADIVNGKALKLPKPTYPALANELKTKKVEVKVSVIINEKGDVVFVCAKNYGGYSIFVNAAEEAAYKAKFKPTLVNGEPYKVSGYITYIFGK